MWHQGETDAVLKSGKSEHYENMKKLISDLRQIKGVEKAPFIAGDFVPLWKNTHPSICNPVTDALKKICNDMPLCVFTQTNGLLSNHEAIKNRDDIHFCRPSLYELGIRYFESFCKTTGY